MLMFKTKYRIVTDDYSGYEVQYKPWWCPWFIQCDRYGGINTHYTLDQAKGYLIEQKYKVNKEKEIVYEDY